MTSDPLPKACVILGAGASHDVLNEASLVKSSVWRPPLAADLFNFQLHPNYAREIIVPRYPDAQYLANSLAPIISQGMASVEEELRKYAEHKNPEFRQKYKQIPAYLRDLLYRSSTDYVDIASCYAQLATLLLMDFPHRVLFLVLNYDSLLESVLRQLDPREYNFSSIDTYVQACRRAIVVKLHGSVDWFRRFGNSQLQTWTEALSELDISQRCPTAEINVLKDIGDCSAPHDGSYLYPLVTAPLAGKALDEVVCPNSHIKAAKEFLSSCNKFLIIGTSGLDEDLFELLKDAISPNARPLVHVVDIGTCC